MTAVASLLALPAFVGEAHAAAKAFSSLHVEDFIASEGGTQFDQGDFDNLGITNSGQNSATLTGFAGEVFGDAGAADIDPDHACVGNGCASIPIGDNNFSQQAFPPPDSFARGDSRQFGAIITGTAASQDSVTADTVAGAQLLTSGETGLGTSNVGTDTVVSFSLIDPRQVTFTFAARGTLDVRLDPDSAPGSSTGADFEFGITIREADGGALVFSWNPNGTVDGAIVGGTENADGANLNQEISRLLPGQTIVDTGLGLFSATTGLLDAGINYTLTISHNSFARASLVLQEVPEPATLALFSLGLLVIGVMAMRRRRSDDPTA
ncbi:MAG TPA: EDSAP-1 family PEP-CTERM protein [Kiloniellaceae bacterium]